MGHGSSKQHRPNQGFSVQPRPTNTTQPPPSHRSMNIQKYDLSKLAVITVIFNPINYKSRYEHYHNFARHMEQSGVNLITVECIFDSASQFGLPRQDFHVTRPNHPQHIQLQAPSIIWIKENLINIAVKRLPSIVEYVAWIDADIEFEHLDWAHLAIAELQRYPIVQLFELSFFLGPAGKSEILRRDYSFGYSIRNNKPINPARYQDWYAHPGYAWAMRRSTFNEMGGLIDFCIIGSGDLHFAFALLGRMEETIRPTLHPDYRTLAVQWAQRVAQIARHGQNVGYVPINIWHFWHGQRDSRNYVDRWTILEKHQFSPLNDLEKHEGTGLLRLLRPDHAPNVTFRRRIEALEADIVAYFKSRAEDSKVQSIPPPQRPPINPKSSGQGRPPPPRQRPLPPNPQKRFPTGRPIGFSKPHLWTSGPSGTHVDDHDPYDHCTCPGHHHHPGDPSCPCFHQPDDQHCWNIPDHHDHHHHHHHTGEGNNWNTSEGHHGHHGHDHHHHHHTDDQNCWNPSDHDYSHHHGTDYHGGGGYDYSGGGSGGTDYSYSGAGSFY